MSLSVRRLAFMSFLICMVRFTEGVQAGNVITLDPATTYQTINGWEACVIQTVWDDTRATETAIPQVLNQAADDGINRVRLEVQSGAENNVDYFSRMVGGQQPGYPERYDIVNDNADPNVINWSGFKFSLLNYSVDTFVLPIKQRLEARGEKLYVNLCYVGDGGGSNFAVHRDSVNEYAEFILAAFLHLRNRYGWAPDAVEVSLEPDVFQTFASGTSVGQHLVAAAQRLAANGFTPDWIAPSNTSMSSALSYFDQMMQVPGVQNYVSELSYHRYSGVSTATLQQIASRSVQYGIGASMLEWWSGANGYPVLHEDLKVGRNTAWQQSIFGDDFNGEATLYHINRTTLAVSPGPMTRYTRQYYKHVRSGARRIGAASSATPFDPLAFVNPNGATVVVVKATSGGSFSIQALPAGTYGLTYTTGAQYNVNLPDVTIGAGQSLNTSIPAAGVLTAYGKAPSPAPGTLRFSASSYSVAENGGLATVTVTRTGGSSGQVTVDYTTSNGSALSASDYTAVSGTLLWASGQTTSRTFTVPVLDDNLPEGSETVHLTLSGLSGGATLGTPGTAVLTIADNDTSSADSDGDGLPDAWEMSHFSNLNQGGSGDPDTDGMTNLQEYAAGTDPANPDSDGDGFSDGQESAAGSDPLDPGSVPGSGPGGDDGCGATGLELLVALFGLRGTKALRWSSACVAIAALLLVGATRCSMANPFKIVLLPGSGNSGEKVDTKYVLSTFFEEASGRRARWNYGAWAAEWRSALKTSL